MYTRRSCTKQCLDELTLTCEGMPQNINFYQPEEWFQLRVGLPRLQLHIAKATIPAWNCKDRWPEVNTLCKARQYQLRNGSHKTKQTDIDTWEVS